MKIIKEIEFPETAEEKTFVRLSGTTVNMRIRELTEWISNDPGHHDVKPIVKELNTWIAENLDVVTAIRIAFNCEMYSLFFHDEEDLAEKIEDSDELMYNLFPKSKRWPDDPYLIQIINEQWEGKIFYEGDD